MEIGIAFAIGIIIGGAAAYMATRKLQQEATMAIEALSAKAVQQQTAQILQLAESKLSGKKDVIDGTLKSMTGDLKRMEQLMQKIGDGNTQVGTRLESAAKVIKELSDTTGGLKTALSGNSSRGQWGERMAEDVLRLAGMVEGINYIKQTKLQESGSRPDFTFMLPQNLTLNMDVKFPFSNYQLYVDAVSESDRETYKKEFMKDVKLRIKELQTRGYVNPEENTVDYVLLFIPNEQIFSFINEHAREIIDEAMRGKTILCSPLSLYAILAVIRQSIDNFRMESKSQEMLKIFAAFHDQWDKFKEQMEKVKNRFEGVEKEYGELLGTRTRQLDRPLEKIKDLQDQHAVLPAAPIDLSIEKAKARVLAPNIDQVLVR